MTAIQLVSDELGEADGEAADGVEVCPGPGSSPQEASVDETERDQRRVHHGPRVTASRPSYSRCRQAGPRGTLRSLRSGRLREEDAGTPRRHRADCERRVVVLDHLDERCRVITPISSHGFGFSHGLEVTDDHRDLFRTGTWAVPRSGRSSRSGTYESRSAGRDRARRSDRQVRRRIRWCACRRLARSGGRTVVRRIRTVPNELPRSRPSRYARRRAAARAMPRRARSARARTWVPRSTSLAR